MKRKVNRVGQNTLTVSLPTKWAKEHGLKQGDELDVLEKDDSLVLSTFASSSHKFIELDISKFGDMSGRVIGALYKAGYDEMKLTYDDPSFALLIEKELSKGFFGLDIIHQARNYSLLKSMAQIKPDELQTSMRRVFRLIIDNSQELLLAVKEKRFDDLLLIAKKDVNVNKFADFSRRLLNKYGYSEKERTGMIYYIIEEIENVGDKYKDLAVFLHKRSFLPSVKVLNMYVLVKDFFEQFYDLFYSFKPVKYKVFGEKYKFLKKEINVLSEMLKGNDLLVLAKLESLVDEIFNLNGPLMTSQFG